MALAVLLIGPGIGPTGCDGLTGIDDLTFERGVDSFCGPEQPCPEGTYCAVASASCQPKNPLGTTCTRVDECISGRCVHGLCCNGPCNATCLACDLPGSEGHCSVVPAGEDPHEQCPGTTACNSDGLCDGRCLWSWAGGDSGADRATHVAIARNGFPTDPDDVPTDKDDEIYVLGTFEGTVEGPLSSKGKSDVFVAKLDATGQRLWSRSFGSIEADQAAGLAVDHEGNIIVAANFAAPVVIAPPTEEVIDGVDAAIIKLDREGNLLWHTIVGLPNGLTAITAATDVTVDPQGNAIATGHFTGGIYYDPTHAAVGSAYDDVFVVKLDGATGGWLWNRELGAGDTYAVRGGSVAAGGDDYVVVSLSGQGTLPLPNETLNGSTVDDDLFLVHLDAASGMPTWGLPFGGQGDQQAGGLAVHRHEPDDPDAIWLTGAFTDELIIPTGGDLNSTDDRDGFYAALDPSGSAQVSGALAGPFDDVPQAVAVHPEGSISIVGHFEVALEAPEGVPLQAMGGTDVFVVMLDSSTALDWAQSFGGPLGDEALAVDTDTLGNIVVVGHFEHSIHFGCDEGLESIGDSDFFVVKLAR